MTQNTQNALVTIVTPATFKDIKDNAQLAVFRVRQYDKKTQQANFFEATAYIKPDKKDGKYVEFLKSLKKHDLIDMTFAMTDQGYANIYKMFKLERKNKVQNA